MRLDRVEALVVEHRLDEAAGRRIAVDRGDNIGTEGVAERRLVLKRVVVGLPDHVGRDVRHGQAVWLTRWATAASRES